MDDYKIIITMMEGCIEIDKGVEFFRSLDILEEKVIGDVVFVTAKSKQHDNKSTFSVKLDDLLIIKRNISIDECLKK